MCVIARLRLRGRASSRVGLWGVYGFILDFAFFEGFTE